MTWKRGNDLVLDLSLLGHEANGSQQEWAIYDRNDLPKLKKSSMWPIKSRGIKISRNRSLRVEWNRSDQSRDELLPFISAALKLLHASPTAWPVRHILFAPQVFRVSENVFILVNARLQKKYKPGPSNHHVIVYSWTIWASAPLVASNGISRLHILNLLAKTM